MTITLPPLLAIVFGLSGYVGGTILASTFGVAAAPEVGAALGGSMGIAMWLASDAPMTTGGLGG